MARTDDSLLAKADEAAQQQQIPGQLAFDPVEMALPEPLVAVPVRDEAPASGTGRVVVLSAANPVLPVLPQDPRRRNAIILAVDNDVYLSHSHELAGFPGAVGTNTGVQAGYLPAGIAIPVTSKRAWSVGATTLATNSRVSVWIFKDDE